MFLLEEKPLLIIEKLSAIRPSIHSSQGIAVVYETLTNS